MHTRRTVLKQGGCAILASVVPLIGRHARAATTTPFDYFISTTGNDANAGTLASPWAITAINTKRAIYAGKRVGLIAGIYPVYSLWQSANYNTPALNVQGGPNPSTMTYIASCDSSGNYSARAAQITASPSGTPGGGLPGTSSSSVAIIGQGYAIANGNVHFDGLSVSDSNGYCFVLYGSNTYGFIIENCEIYNVGGSEGNNPAGVMQNNCVGNQIKNNKIHDVQLQGSSPGDGNHNCAGLFSFGCSGNFYTNNTIYNCNSCAYDKNSNNGGHTYAYNYLEANGTSPQLIIRGGGEVAGQTRTVHHNIMVLGSGATSFYDGAIDSGPNYWTPYGSINFYSNTLYALGGFQWALQWQAEGTTVSPPATISLWNNLYALPTPSPYSTLILGSYAGSVRSPIDYNGYFGTTTPKFQTGATYTTLAAWQTAIGAESHSHNSASTSGLFVNPGQPQLPSGYQLVAGTSPAIGKGSTNGLSSGSACDLGAWGYDPALGAAPTQIGADFSANPVPGAPMLKVS